MADVSHKDIRGAKGGSQEQRQPVEAPDSLRSTSYARVLDLISEGEIVGLVDGAKSIYLDETPIQNADGSYNFENVNFEVRTGTPDQSYLQGFPAVENEISVGVELRPDLPFVRQITNTSLSAVKVRLSTPQLSKADTSTGDISGHTVEYVIDLAVDGGQYETIARTGFRGKTSSKYERNHRIDLPAASEGWLLRIRRITPMANSSSTADMTFVESYTEIIDAKLRYPNSALVGVSVDAEQFSSVPSRSYHAKGRIIRVPSNYDPVARTYSGLWDGTFKTAYTNNPAWVYFDLVTHPRYGLGHLVDDYHVDKWALYKIGRYCDEMVPDGFGGMEPRFACNAYFQTRADAYKVLMDLTSIFRGLTFWANEQIITAADMPEDPVYLYNPSNVVDGKFQYAGTSKKARHTVALVSWNDMSDFGRVKLEYVEDPGGVARYGVHQIEATAIGCTSQGQAHRCGNWMLLTERYETDTVTFSVGLDGTLAHPGQIIEVMDPLRAGSRLGGRVSSAAGQTITVDAMPTPAPEMGDALTVVLPSGISQRRLISRVNVAARTITVDRAFDETPEAEAVWAVESSTLKTQLYRVLGVTENEDLTFTITALQHEPGKFDAADRGVRLDERPTVGRPRPTIDAPEQVTLTAYERAGEVTASTIVTVDWHSVPGANHYIVQWRRNSGTWSAPMQIDGLSYDIEGAFAGVYEARVAAVSRTATSRPRMSGPLEVSDQSLPPKMVERLSQDLVDAQRALGEEERLRVEEDAKLAQELAEEVAERARLLAEEATARNEALAEEAATRARDLAQETRDRTAALAAETEARNAALAAETAARLQAQQEIAATAAAQADAARDAAIAYADVIGAQVADILEADEWSEESEYPKGDLTQFDGKLHRALQDVPAGTPLDDPDYWQVVGNYSSLGAAVAGSIDIGMQNTSAIEAESHRLTGLLARVPGGEDMLGTDARITQVESAAASANAANAARIESVEASIGDLEDDVAAKASSEALSALTGRVEATEGEIQAVSGQITNLSTAIDEKASSEVVDLLDSRVIANENEIESQSLAITSMQDSLTDLQGDVATKASAAALNGLDSRVTATEGMVESHSGSITALQNSIGSLEGELANAATAAAVSALDSRVEAAEGAVASTSSSLTELQNTINHPSQGLGSKASASALQTLTNEVRSSSTGLPSKASSAAVTALQNQINDPATGLASKASASALSALETTVSEIEVAATDMVEISARLGTIEGALVNEMITSAQKDAALTSSVNLLEARMEDAEAGVMATADAVDGLTTRVSSVEGTVTSHSSRLTTLQAQVNALDVDAGGSGAAIAELDTRVTEAEGAIQSHGNAITALQNSVTSANKTFIQSSQPSTSGRTTGDLWIDTANGNRIWGFDGSKWVLRQDTNKNTVFVQGTQPTARATNDLWFDTSRNNRQFRWDGSKWVEVSDTRVAANASAISSLTTRVSNAEGVNTTQSQQITTLQNTVNHSSTGVKATANAVSSLTNRVTTAEGKIATNSSAITSLQNAVNNPTTGLIATADAVSALETRIEQTETVNTSQGSAITALQNTVNHSTTGVKATANALSALTTRVSNTESVNTSQGSAITSLQNTVNHSTTGVKATANALSALTTRVSSAESVNTSQGSAITSLQNTVNNSTTGVAATASALSALRTRVTNAEGTLSSQASSISSLSTTVGNHTTTITSHASSINGLRGKAGVTVNANGHITGWTLNNDGKSGDMTIVADRFKIVTPGQTARTPFSLTSSRLQLATDLYMGSGRIVSESGGYMKVQGTGFGTSNQFIEWFGPKMAINKCSEANAISYHHKDGAIKTGGLIEGSLISAGALSLNSTRIHTGGGRMAPFSLKDVAFHGRPTGTQSMTLTLSDFQAPNRGSGYHARRFAAHKMDVFLDALAHADSNGYETCHLEVQYNSGAWEPIVSLRQHVHNRATIGLSIRYTTKSSWNTVAFRARTSEGRTTAMSFKLDVANYNESGNAANSHSGINSSSGAGGVPPGGGGGWTPEDPRMPPQVLL